MYNRASKLFIAWQSEKYVKRWKALTHGCTLHTACPRHISLRCASNNVHNFVATYHLVSTVCPVILQCMSCSLNTKMMQTWGTVVGTIIRSSGCHLWHPVMGGGSFLLLSVEKEGKKTTSFGVNSSRSQVLYRAAQCYLLLLCLHHLGMKSAKHFCCWRSGCSCCFQVVIGIGIMIPAHQILVPSVHGYMHQTFCFAGAEAVKFHNKKAA